MAKRMAHSPDKLPPVHPGEILNRDFLLPMNVTQYRLAKAIGVDSRRIHSIVHGERSITAETALLLSRFFGNSASFWMGLQSQYDLETTEDRLSERLSRIELGMPEEAVRDIYGFRPIPAGGNQVTNDLVNGLREEFGI